MARFRDAETAFIINYNLEVKQWTLFQVVADNQRMNIVKDRAVQLQEFVKMLED